MQPQATPSAHKRRNPQPIEVAAIPDSLLNVETVSALIGAGRSRIYDVESKGLFPSAIRLGTRCTRWRAGRVDFTKVDPVAAREIFIREALVGGQWESKFPFLTANRKLLREVEGLEACVSEIGDLRILPHHLAAQGGMDGFYICRLQKR